MPGTMDGEETSINSISKSVPVGNVSDRVQKIKTKALMTDLEKPTANGHIGKAQTLTPTHRKKAMKTNGFLSHGRISGGKYLVTGVPSGIANHGFSDSIQNISEPPVNRQLLYTDDLLDGPEHIHALSQTNRHSGSHGHMIANKGTIRASNGTLRVSKMTLARRHYNSGHGPRSVSSSTRSHSSYKTHAVTRFEIELNESLKYQYRPGEEISGNITLELCKNLEIRYLELVVIGVGNASLTKSGKLYTQQENYMYKQTCVLGDTDSRYTSLLTPGKYVSNFRFRLSKDVPSSIDYDEQFSGLRFNISYFLKARLIDASKYANVRRKHRGPQHKSLISYRLDFKVLRPFDVNMIPDGNIPINHIEEVALACSNNSTATVALALDRSVFLAGDDIRLQISLTIPGSKKIKEIICSLQQHVSFKTPGQRASYCLVQLQNKNPEETAVVTVEHHQRTSSYEVVVPTHNATLPSFNYGCTMLTITYSVKTLIKFSKGGGNLTIAVPIAIGPCAEPIYFEKSAFKKAVPVFNKPLRFPCFTPASRNSSYSYSQDRGSQSSRNVNVVSKYDVSPLGRCLMCCFRGKKGK